MEQFTVDQANRTLPLVRRIVEDIVREHRRWEDAIVQLDLLVNGVTVSSPSPQATNLERDIQAIAREVQGPVICGLARTAGLVARGIAFPGHFLVRVDATLTAGGFGQRISRLGSPSSQNDVAEAFERQLDIVEQNAGHGRDGDPAIRQI
mgnify:CR=1 FL=1